MPVSGTGDEQQLTLALFKQILSLSRSKQVQYYPSFVPVVSGLLLGQRGLRNVTCPVEEYCLVRNDLSSTQSSYWSNVTTPSRHPVSTNVLL